MALAASTMAFSVSRSMSILIIGRFIQGVSAASVSSAGLAILADSFSDQGIGLAMGALDTSIALGSAAGPVVGGLIYHYYGYGSVFFSAYILIALDLALRLLMLERDPEVYLDPQDHNHNHQLRLENPRYTEYSPNRSVNENLLCYLIACNLWCYLGWFKQCHRDHTMCKLVGDSCSGRRARVIGKDLIVSAAFANCRVTAHTSHASVPSGVLHVQHCSKRTGVCLAVTDENRIQLQLQRDCIYPTDACYTVAWWTRGWLPWRQAWPKEISFPWFCGHFAFAGIVAHNGSAQLRPNDIALRLVAHDWRLSESDNDAPLHGGHIFDGRESS